jgi:glucosamine--fructose-6-phosphate aminotransferase (isomerizing)
MCGIAGYIGHGECLPILLSCLKRLEYRGYDSAGVSFVTDNGIEIVKSLGKVSELEKKLLPVKFTTNTGIAHTRWATHGKPSELNAHPHSSTDGNISVIHNGIIENYVEIRKMLKAKGYFFKSETDTEVIAHLIDLFYKNNYSFFESVRHALKSVEGTYGLAVLSSYNPGKVIIAKKGSPLVIGIGKDENFIASDVTAFISYTDKVVYLEDEEIAEITPFNIETRNIGNEPVLKSVHEVRIDISEISKAGYEHFMLKEIMEQPFSVKNSFRGRLLYEEGISKLGGLEEVMPQILQARRIIICACGTSWHSALAGEYMIEQYAGIPVEVEYASEFRYRNPVITNQDVLIFISQSGETADTLAALKEAKSKGALVIGICNAVASSIARESHGGIYIHAGPEIGVASTKAFTSQLVVLALITVLLARNRGMKLDCGKNFVNELNALPAKISQILELNLKIREIASRFSNASNFLYLGRGFNFPVALEGALKLKEISYIHAEGYPAAEMKHGPIALIDNNMPVVFIAPKDSIYEKVISNIQEVKARNGRIIVITTDDDTKLEEIAEHVIKVPRTIESLLPILTVVPLQLLAYHIAVLKGLNVDQPRNLAKSVTVE